MNNKFKVRNINTGESLQWDLHEVIDEVNWQHGESFDRYDKTNWFDGWSRHVEGNSYAMIEGMIELDTPKEQQPVIEEIVKSKAKVIAMNIITADTGEVDIEQCFDLLTGGDHGTLEEVGFEVWEEMEDHDLNTLSDIVMDVYLDVIRNFNGSH